MKAVVAAFNQEKALVGAFFVITNLCVDLPFQALSDIVSITAAGFSEQVMETRVTKIFATLTRLV